MDLGLKYVSSLMPTGEGSLLGCLRLSKSLRNSQISNWLQKFTLTGEVSGFGLEHSLVLSTIALSNHEYRSLQDLSALASSRHLQTLPILALWASFSMLLAL